jgi:hypothetical protein
METITLTDLPMPTDRPIGCDHVPYRHEETGIVYDGHTTHVDRSISTHMLRVMVEVEPCPRERAILASILVNRRGR